MSSASLLKKRIGWFVLAAVVLMIVAFANREDPKKETQQTPDAVPVEVATVSAEPLTETVDAVGTVSALHDVNVGSETAGRVLKVLFNLGDVVRTGQTLVVVDNELKAAALDQAKAQALAAETNYGKTQHDFARAESLYQSRDIADAELEGNRLALHSAEAQYKGAQAALRAAARQMSDTKIKSPIDGVIASKRIEVGEMVSPGKEVANIVDIATVKIKLGIAEEYIAKVAQRQKAALRIDARPDLRLEGTVLAVGAKTESPTGHTYPVEVVVKNTKARDLKVGMFVRVQIATRAVRNALSIPVESVVNSDAAPHVFVVENGVARLRSVRLGVRSVDKCQILDGLKAGDTIVSFGQKDLRDGSAVLVK
jgi:RND family efflux transporter MFP subunit